MCNHGYLHKHTHTHIYTYKLAKNFENKRHPLGSISIPFLPSYHHSPCPSPSSFPSSPSSATWH